MGYLPGSIGATSGAETTSAGVGINAPATVYLPPVTSQPAENKKETATAQGSNAAINDYQQPAQTRLNTAMGGYIPIAYGSCRFAPEVYLAEVHPSSGALILGLLIGEGEIDAVTALELNNAPLRANCSYTVYRGLPTQSIDPTISAAMAAGTPARTYTDALHGIAHVVVVLGAGSYTVDEISGFDVTLRGKKVYDPRSSGQTRANPQTWTYSTNAALILSDFIASAYAAERAIAPRYGRNCTVDAAGLIECANWCDTLVGTAPAQQKRCEFNGALQVPTPDETWEQSFRTAAMAFVNRVGSTVYFSADKPRIPVLDIGDSTGAGNTFSFERIAERRADVVPTVMEVTFPDISTKPWGTKTFRISSAGALAGTEPEVVESINIWWARSYSAAYRYGLQRFLAKRLSNRTWATMLRGEGFGLMRGEVVSATHRIGFNGKLLVVDRVDDRGYCDLRVQLSEYDPAMYSDNAEIEPTYDGSGNANCATYPSVTAFTAAQQSQNEAWNCVYRIASQWSVSHYPCLSHYEIEISQSATVVQSAQVGSKNFVSIPLSAGTYTISMRLVSSVVGMAPGPWSSATVTISSVVCKPNPPESVWVRGERTARVDYSGYFQFAWQLIVFVDPPTSAITETELFFGWGENPNFFSASLVKSGSGHVPAFAYWRGNTAYNASLYYQEAATLKIGSVPYIPQGDAANFYHPGLAPSGTYPDAITVANAWQLPSKIWVRFKSGSVVSDPVEVKISLPDVIPHAGSFNQTTRYGRSLDGALKASALSEASRSYSAISFPYPTFSAVLGVATYQYLGGSNHQISGVLFNQSGDRIDGYLSWVANQIDPQQGA